MADNFSMYVSTKNLIQPGFRETRKYTNELCLGVVTDTVRNLSYSVKHFGAPNGDERRYFPEDWDKCLAPTSSSSTPG